MTRSIVSNYRNIIAVAAVISSVILVGGCGNNSAESDMSTPTQSAPMGKLATVAPTETKVKFDKLTLEGKVTRVVDANGIETLSFSYADNDGQVYKCKLPAAMAEGEYLPSEWVVTFNSYRLPEVIKKKAMPKNASKNGISGFPFIAPKPEAPKPATDQTTPTPTPTQTTTPMPYPTAPMPYPTTR